jgi:hypothetical protein
MIDENFVNAAVRIRREYLKVNSNLDLYKRRAREITANIDNLIHKVEDIQENFADDRNSVEEAVGELAKVVQEFEIEGQKLQKLVDPLNKQVEKLGLEEQELWRAIKIKHGDIPENVIIEYVKQRLIRENLS